MKNKIVTAFEQIDKKTQVDSLVGKLTTLCTAAIQCDKFEVLVDDVSTFFENLLISTFDNNEQSE